MKAVSDPGDDEKARLFSMLSVPRGTQDKLTRYVDLLSDWNQKINLVAAGSLSHVWSRHVLDSAQLMQHVPPETQSLADMGSGAGFPGLVLAIMGVPRVHLIESIGKKAAFLQAVVDDLGLAVTVHNARIEALKGLRCDVVTARALKSLPELLKYANLLMHKGSVGLFLKGQNVDAELTEALKYWTFRVDKTPSLSDPTGAILKIFDLKAKSPHGHRQRTSGHRPPLAR